METRSENYRAESVSSWLGLSFRVVAAGSRRRSPASFDGFEDTSEDIDHDFPSPRRQLCEPLLRIGDGIHRISGSNRRNWAVGAEWRRSKKAARSCGVDARRRTIGNFWELRMLKQGAYRNFIVRVEGQSGDLDSKLV